MPKIGSQDLEQHRLTNDSYGYSAVGLDKLGATEYTLVTIVCDKSGSVSPFKNELEACLKEIVKACAHSPRADFLMARLVAFSDDLEEVHGFKLLSSINQADYDGAINCGGNTALYDAASNAIKATTDYARALNKQDFSVNAIVFVLTDGDNNQGKGTIAEVKKALAEGTKTEALESLVSILVAVNAQDYQSVLDDFHKKACFTQFVNIGDASKNKLAKLAQFVSKSISAQSQALGTGGPSKPLTF